MVLEVMLGLNYHTCQSSIFQQVSLRSFAFVMFNLNSFPETRYVLLD